MWDSIPKDEASEMEQVFALENMRKRPDVEVKDKVDITKFRFRVEGVDRSMISDGFRQELQRVEGEQRDFMTFADDCIKARKLGPGDEEKLSEGSDG